MCVCVCKIFVYIHYCDHQLYTRDDHSTTLTFLIQLYKYRWVYNKNERSARMFYEWMKFCGVFRIIMLLYVFNDEVLCIRLCLFMLIINIRKENTYAHKRNCFDRGAACSQRQKGIVGYVSVGFVYEEKRRWAMHWCHSFFARFAATVVHSYIFK